MTVFTIGIAGCAVEVRAIYESTKTFCQGYLTDRTPELSVTVTPEDIVFERKKSEREHALEGIENHTFSDSYLELLAVYRQIASWMLRHDTLLFHGSAIAVDGEAYLFTAKSGTGKSTHSRLWREQFGDRAVMINDDKPLLKLTADGVLVCGTPWNGKHRLGSNLTVPLKAICVLERGLENRICSISPREALPMLLQQSYRTQDPAGMNCLLDILDRLSGAVRFYRLQCNMEPEAALIAYAGMQDGAEDPCKAKEDRL